MKGNSADEIDAVPTAPVDDITVAADLATDEVGEASFPASGVIEPS